MAFTRFAVLLGALFAISPARAADLSSAQAAALEAQLHTWLASLVEPAFALPTRPVQLTAEGDHLSVLLPIAGLDGDAAPKAVTAIARPGEHGTWVVSDIRLPSPASISVTVPVKDGKRITQHTSWAIGEQQGQMVIDPALGVVTSSNFAVHGLDVRSDSELGHTQQHYDLYSGETTAMPAANGRLDFAETARVDGMRVHSDGHDQPSFDLTARKLSARGDLTGVDIGQASRVVAASTKLIAASMAAASTAGGAHDLKHMRPVDRQAVRTLLAALNDVALGLRGEETVDDLAIQALGQEVKLAHVAIGMGVEAPARKLRASVKLALEGFAAPQLPHEYADLLPTRIALEPVVSGIGTADLERLMMAATEPDANEQTMAPAVAKVFADGGVTVGLENVRIEMPGTSLGGKMEVRLLGPQSVQGVARIEASGLDRLIDRAKADPTLSQALPFLILARGLAKPDGEGLAWDITFDESRKVVVNGTDLSQIAGGAPHR